MIDVFSYGDVAFPEGFLWGASTAGAQIEGNLRSFYDDPETAPKTPGYVFPGSACNSFERYTDDIALLERMGLNLYRFSVEWARLEPDKGVYDQAALGVYLDMLEQLKRRGIKSCVTLHHFAHPVWFHKQGHFDTLDNLGDWERYLEWIVPKLAPHVDFWTVVNEMNLPFVYTIDQRLNLLHYHAIGYHVVKRHSDKPVCSALSYSPKMPLRPYDALDELVARQEDYTCNEYFFHAIRTGEITSPYRDARYLPDLKGSCDFWSLNTYVRHMIDGRKGFPLAPHYAATSFKPLGSGHSHMDEIWPELMIDMLLRAKDKPCMITENGIATDDDGYRIAYIASMLRAIRQAMDLGADVTGYAHWSLLDNWEWGSYGMPFGLAAVDFDSFERTLRPSGAFLGAVARSNALLQADIRAHLKRMPSDLDRA